MPTVIDLSAPVEPSPPELPDLLRTDYSQIERLANLGALPSTGFRLSCFPLRILGASAAPARVVAILDD